MKEQSRTAKFQFKNYKIIKSHFELKGDNPSTTINLKFDPKGTISKENSCFKLNLYKRNVIVDREASGCKGFQRISLIFSHL